MKNFILASLAVFTAALVSCEDSTEAPDDRPAIQSISFPNVPEKNVSFDKANSIITVKMPAVVEGGLKPVMKLTDGAEPLDLLSDGTIDLSSYCGCFSGTEPNVTLRIGNQKATSTYIVKIISSGPLTPQEKYEETIFSRKTGVLSMSLPVQNLYARHNITVINFKALNATGVTRIYADGACLAGCRGDAPNRLGFTLYSPIDKVLKPGTYTISIGNLEFPQRLVVTD